MSAEQEPLSPNEKGEEPAAGEGGELDKAEKEGLKGQTSGVSLSGVSPSHQFSVVVVVEMCASRSGQLLTSK